MPRITRVLHRTEYRYDRPVKFNQHRLMLRPRDGHDLWVDKALLVIEPKATLRWSFDTFGNSIAEATFEEEADRLLIESELFLRRYVADLSSKAEEGHICPYPFSYGPDEMLDLNPFLSLHNRGDAEALDPWLAANFAERPGCAFDLLCRLSDAIHGALSYSARDEMGTQSAAETLEKGVGTCRDYAFLFMEAARRLGFAARFVTGYLNDMSQGEGGGPIGGGATHAWADVFVPGEGWIEFDPTNRITAGGELIRVATTRTPDQASPISGSFSGEGAICTGLDVSVEVSELESQPGQG